MVVLKHVLLATLATLAIASPPSNQWGKHDGTGAGVAPSGRPGGNTAGSGSMGGGTGSGEHGNGQHSGNGHLDGDKPKTGGNGNADKKNQNQPRAWPEKPNGAPGGAPTWAGQHGSWPSSGQDHSRGDKPNVPAGNGGGSDKDHPKQPRDMKKTSGPPGSAPSGAGQHGGSGGVSGGGSESQGHGNGQHSGEGKHPDGKPPGMDGKGGGDIHHHARDDASKHREFGNDKKDDHQQGGHPGKGDRHDHDRRDALEARNPAPSIELDDDDEGLAELRNRLFGGDGDRNGTDSENHPAGKISKRAGVFGIYECMHHNFVAPCKWTQLTSETFCYNK